MKGIEYEVEVYESFLHHTNGLSYKTREIFLQVEDRKIAFDEKGNIFETNEERYKEAKFIKEVEVADEHAGLFMTYLFEKEKAKEIAKKYFESP